MVDGVPSEVQRWLSAGPMRLAWIRVEAGLVSDLGGAVAVHGLTGVVIGKALPSGLHWTPALEGPLPLELPAVASEHGSAERSDVRAWEDGGAVFIVLTDSSQSARMLGVPLQQWNEGDLLRDRLAGAERLRRDERRARAEVLSILGYELLEESPDGSFRPPSDPAPWLADLCGWAPGAPRVVALDDATSFLPAFLGDAAEFLAETRAGRGVRAEGVEVSPDLEILSSGVWSEQMPGADGTTHEASFEAHALALTGGRGVVAVERLHPSVSMKQEALQHQRDAQLSYEGLAREVQVKDVLLHCIVHDLRGPLSSLVGSLSLLESGGLDDSDRKELIAIGLRQARRQDEMIRHVLDVFGAEYDALRKFEVDPKSAPDAVTISSETVQRLMPAFRAEEKHLVLDAPQGGFRVIGRADRLERVLANLLGNARRHSPAGGEVRLVVRATDGAALPEFAEAPPGHGAVEISVLDRGPGVPGALKGQLFHRFVQGGSGGGAAGLGLFYVRMTVERWGGTVRYEDRPGGGAAFHVTLRQA